MNFRKKGFAGLIFALLITMLMAMPVSAASAKLNKTKATVVVGKTVQLTVSNTSKTVTWSSSKKSVATVDSKGLVTAKKAGSAIITAKVGNKSLRCTVTVKDNIFSSKIKDWSKATVLKNTGSCLIRAQVKKVTYDSEGRLNVRFVFQNSTAGSSYTMQNATITIRKNNSGGKILGKGTFRSSDLVTISPLGTDEAIFVFTGTDTRNVINLNKTDKIYFKITVKE